MKLHHTITVPRLIKAAADRRAVVCIRCGRHEAGDPDAEHLPCKGCGESLMFGAHRLLELKLPKLETKAC